MRLKARICNVKRHTVGYINGSGHRLTVDRAVEFARKGRIEDVVVKSINGREYISSVPDADQKLLDLPEFVLEFDKN